MQAEGLALSFSPQASLSLPFNNMSTSSVRRQLPESFSSQTECSYLPLPAEKF